MRLKSFVTMVQTPSKWPGRLAPQRSCERLVSCSWMLRSAEKLLGLRSEDHVRAVVAAERQVLDEGARIFGKVLAGAELERVDEDADGDVAVLAGDLTRGTDERGMALVQSAHGRHEDAARAFVDGAPGAELADVVDDIHDFRSLDSNTA
jgi:hypothetical protein